MDKTLSSCRVRIQNSKRVRSYYAAGESSSRKSYDTADQGETGSRVQTIEEMRNHMLELVLGDRKLSSASVRRLVWFTYIVLVKSGETLSITVFANEEKRVAKDDWNVEEYLVLITCESAKIVKREESDKVKQTRKMELCEMCKRVSERLGGKGLLVTCHQALANQRKKCVRMMLKKKLFAQNTEVKKKLLKSIEKKAGIKSNVAAFSSVAEKRYDLLLRSADYGYFEISCCKGSW
ncbi:hypothetical protein Tco_0369512 [Tanacetum coccineum]